MVLELSLIEDFESSLFKSVLDMRERVVVLGLGMDKFYDFDGFDEISDQYAILLNNNLVGCFRIREFENRLYVERFFIDPYFRSRGLAPFAIRFVIKEYYTTKLGLFFEVGKVFESFFAPFGLKLSELEHPCSGFLYMEYSK